MEMDDSLISLFGDEPRLLPSVHLSIQSGNNIILKRMKRRHQREDVIKVCEKSEKRPEVTFGADLIVGFQQRMKKCLKIPGLLCEKLKSHNFMSFPTLKGMEHRSQDAPGAKSRAQRRAKVLRSDGVAQLQSILDEGIGSKAKVLIENGKRACERFLPVIMNKTTKLAK